MDKNKQKQSHRNREQTGGCQRGGGGGEKWVRESKRDKLPAAK